MTRRQAKTPVIVGPDLKQIPLDGVMFRLETAWPGATCLLICLVNVLPIVVYR